MLDSQFGGQIRLPKTAEVLANRIRKRIIRGDLKPGDKLPPEAGLVVEFEVSRPTVREAIRILESEGLISVSRGAGGGARVNEPSGDLIMRTTGLALQTKGATIRDIYEARALLEPPAAHIAAERRSKKAAAALREHLVHVWAPASDTIARAKAVAQFHRILLEECGNTTLAVIGVALHDVVERHLEISYRDQRFLQASRTEIGFRSCERLIELIEAGLGAEAETHWIRHMAAAGEYWLKKVGSKAVVDILD